MELRVANQLLRSAHEISTREGRDTDWVAFRARLEPTLVVQNTILNG